MVVINRLEAGDVRTYWLVPFVSEIFGAHFVPLVKNRRKTIYPNYK